MGIERIGHIYAETTQWEASTSFWHGLGFSFVERWGSEGHRAGRLENGSATVVLAEVKSDPAFNVFFEVTDIADLDLGADVIVTTALEDTHWGTRWMRVTDPDGRTFSLEDAG
jgi:catechol 2,3-dioxygenase-like lactoylglutathione lyase family enzyme